MPDIEEVFRMSTQKVDQEPGALERQFKRRDRKNRNRKIGAFAVVACIAAVAIVAALATSAERGSPAPGVANEPDGTVQTQTHVFAVNGDPGLNSSYVISMELLDGYEGDPGDVVFGSDGGQGISTWAVANVYADPCHSNGTLLDPPIDSSVDGLVAGLATQKGRHATTPTDVDVDGYAGKYLEVTVPAGIDTADCDHGQYRTWVEPQWGGNRYLEAGQRDLLWIIDVDGDRLVIDAALGPQTTEQDRADRIQMVESIQIDPV